jgi:hypothetical protein
MSAISTDSMHRPIDHTITTSTTTTICTCFREQSSSSIIDVNQTFVSVYIDKDEDYLARPQNASFSCSENRCDCGRKINRSRTSLKNVRVISRRKFYKWAWASTGDVDTIKKRYQRSTSQQIARRLGLVRRR